MLALKRVFIDASKKSYYGSIRSIRHFLASTIAVYIVYASLKAYKSVVLPIPCSTYWVVVMPF